MSDSNISTTANELISVKPSSAHQKLAIIYLKTLKQGIGRASLYEMLFEVQQVVYFAYSFTLHKAK